MTIAGRVERALALLVCSLLAGHVGCRRSSKQDDGARLCASACAGWVQSCGIEAGPCIAACEQARAAARNERCDDAHASYLACLSAARPVCDPAPSPGVAFVHGGPGRECSAELARYGRCSEACRERGVVRTGNRELLVGGQKLMVSAEQTAAGCDPVTPEPTKRAPAGSRCEAASVCSAALCPCPGAAPSSLARACVGGSCADAEAACRLVPLAVGHDVCQKPR
jgi:hypothetical protein